VLSGLRHLLLALIVTGGFAGAVHAEVQGMAWWNYSDYQRDYKEDTRNDLDSRSFLQNYSVLYGSKHQINHGQAGYWDVNLGYQWTSLATTLNDDDSTITDGKVLYNGEMVFAPGGLPLRLELYSRDLTVARPTDSATALIERGPYLDLMNSGQHVETGIRFWGGIKNGSYLGLYRETLAHLPKLLIDYKDTYVRNLEALNQEHYHLRDLAFVSLNKKDNWFHYRVNQYKDLIDSTNDYEDRIYMIGTVDHTLMRQWINLTNWIQVSVDGSLEQYDAQDRLEDSYRLNLFTKAQRNSWVLSNFTSYERNLESFKVGNRPDKLKKILEIPVLASGQYDSLNRWRMSLYHKSEEDSYGNSVTTPLWNEHISYATYQLESQRPSGNIATSTVFLDTKRSTRDGQNGMSARAEIELRTDSRRDLPTAWLAKYAVSLFDNQDRGDTFIEQELALSADRQASSELRFGGSQRLILGFGDYKADSTEYLRSRLSGAAGNTSSEDNDVSGTSWRSLTNLFLELNSSPRLRHRFAADVDFISRNEGRLSQLNLSHNLRYDDRDLSASWLNNYVTGDDVVYPVYQSKLGLLQYLAGIPDWSFASVGTIAYSPRRNWSTGGTAGFVWVEGTTGSTGMAFVDQKATYTVFSESGLQRRIFELQQDLFYEHYTNIDSERSPNGTPWYAGLRLVASYFPYQLLTISSRVEFRHYGLTGSNVTEYGVTAEVPFEKFQVQVAYEYGVADKDCLETAAVKEQRWEIDIKKTF